MILKRIYFILIFFKLMYGYNSEYFKSDLEEQEKLISQDGVYEFGEELNISPVTGEKKEFDKLLERNGLFYLFTRDYQNGNKYEILDALKIQTIKDSHFIGTRPTFILVHGYLEYGLKEWVLTLKDKLLQKGDSNVISVSWPSFSLDYHHIVDTIPSVGNDMALFIQSLIDQKELLLESTHCIGHSLGAHICGIMGKSFKGRLGRISGLDPAKPVLFDLSSTSRLNKTDAGYVDVIHTNACNGSMWKCFGLDEKIGHSDFYPSGGNGQPACVYDLQNETEVLGTICCHIMAHEYYIASFDFNRSTSHFLARSCDSWDQYLKGDCSCGKSPQYMGFNVNTELNGTFYLDVLSTSPYAKEDYGCSFNKSSIISRDAPHKNISGLENNVIKKGVQLFYLFTRDYENGRNYEFLNPKYEPSMDDNHFVANRTTYIILHGFMGYGLDDWIVQLKDKLLQKEDCNVISIYWYAGSSIFDYTYAVDKTPIAGNDTAFLLKSLTVHKGLALESVHCIGHSLGAHVCGFTGKSLKGRLGRISGLDPAGPQFHNLTSTSRLDKTDAGYVDIIHTNACDGSDLECFGLDENIGHSDFYPNGGEYQPACINGDHKLGDPCSHSMSHIYYTESLDFSPSTTYYLARPCVSWDQYKKGNCPCGKSPQHMGFNVNTKLTGAFYLNVHFSSPYAKEDTDCATNQSSNISRDIPHKNISGLKNKLKEELVDGFYLFTRDFYNGRKYEFLNPLNESTLDNNHFEANRTTYIIIHGFMGDGFEKWIMMLKDKLLQKEDCNVISISWETGDYYWNYNEALLNAPDVGNETAFFLQSLTIHKGLVLDSVHCIGHSLGAHVCGFTGKPLKGRLGRISGLDPAGPGYRRLTSSSRLDKTDAGYVDIIHTNSCNGSELECFGLDENIGHSDFYPNGGNVQPACALRPTDDRKLGGTCSHVMSHIYYTESLNFSTSTTYFLARPCVSYDQYKKENCSCGKSPQYLGFNVNTKLNGTFYLDVLSKPPYAKEDNGCLSDQWSDSSIISTVTNIVIILANLGLLILVVSFVMNLTKSCRTFKHDEEDPLLANRKFVRVKISRGRA